MRVFDFLKVFLWALGDSRCLWSLGCPMEVFKNAPKQTNIGYKLKSWNAFLEFIF